MDSANEEAVGITKMNGGKLHMQRIRTVTKKDLDIINSQPSIRLGSTDTVIRKLAGDTVQDIPINEGVESDEEEKKEEAPAKKSSLKTSSIYETAFMKNFGRDGFNRVAILMFGKLYPKNTVEQEYIYDLCLEILNEANEANQRIVVVFFRKQSGLVSRKHTSLFRKLYNTHKQLLLETLDEFIVVKPSFFMRVYFYWSRDKNLKERTLLLKGLGALHQKGYFYRDQLTAALPDYLRKKKHEKLKSRSAASFDGPFSSPKKQKSKKGKKAGVVFGIELEQLSREETNFPDIFSMLFSYFFQNEQNFKLEGLFRKPGDAMEIEKLAEKVDRGEFQSIIECTSPHVVCSLIKRIFRSLPSPLIPISTYNNLVNFKSIQQNEEKLSLLLEQFLDMPEINRVTFQSLVKFLTNIARESYINKMNEYNLAVVFAPNLFRNEKIGMQEALNAGNFVKVLEFCIVHFEEIFGQALD